ncbi:HNH endonuclease [Erythrobacter sp. QSSC1-22B]|uniref:HNH endonuclease n=1 Tax=Erythrobacter sp. QSSC1-22B TaxID=1860125 RepID=UPI003512E3CA
MSEWPYHTARWRRLRKVHLQIEPLCRGCPMPTVASHVDHVQAISQGGDPFPSHDGLASYCPSCHSRKTARGPEAGAVSTDRPMKGCDAQGNPLDPSHPWAGNRSGLRDRSPPGNKHAKFVVANVTKPGLG